MAWPLFASWSLGKLFEIKNMSKDHKHNIPNTGSSNIGRAFAWGVGLNSFFIATEITFGLIAGSIALIADAAHNFSDVLGLLLSWGALILARRIPWGRFTYGYRSATILSVLASTALLFVAVGGIVWSAIGRFGEPIEVASGIVILVALVGIGINGFSAWLLSRGNADLNVKSAFMHLLADAAVSAGVVVAGIIIYFTGWNVVDPIVSLVISAVVLWGGWGVLRDAVKLALNAVPDSVSLSEVKKHLEGLQGVARVHDLHVWAISTTHTALTAHLVMPQGNPGDEFLHKSCRDLHDKYGIGHATLQIERGEGEECELAPDEIV